MDSLHHALHALLLIDRSQKVLNWLKIAFNMLDEVEGLNLKNVDEIIDFLHILCKTINKGTVFDQPNQNLKHLQQNATLVKFLWAWLKTLKTIKA